MVAEHLVFCVQKTTIHNSDMTNGVTPNLERAEDYLRHTILLSMTIDLQPMAPGYYQAAAYSYDDVDHL